MLDRLLCLCWFAPASIEEVRRQEKNALIIPTTISQKQIYQTTWEDEAFNQHGFGWNSLNDKKWQGSCEKIDEFDHHNSKDSTATEGTLFFPDSLQTQDIREEQEKEEKFMDSIIFRQISN